MFCGNNYSRAVAKSEILLISSIIVVMVFMFVDKIGRVASMRVMSLLTLFSFFIFSTNLMIESSWMRKGTLLMSQVQVFKNAYSNFMTATYKESISEPLTLIARQNEPHVPKSASLLIRNGSPRDAFLPPSYVRDQRISNLKRPFIPAIFASSRIHDVLCLRFPTLPI